jgi:hypothetical protein
VRRYKARLFRGPLKAAHVEHRLHIMLHAANNVGLVARHKDTWRVAELARIQGLAQLSSDLDMQVDNK